MGCCRRKLYHRLGLQKICHNLATFEALLDEYTSEKFDALAFDLKNQRIYRANVLNKWYLPDLPLFPHPPRSNSDLLRQLHLGELTVRIPVVSLCEIIWEHIAETANVSDLKGVVLTLLTVVPIQPLCTMIWDYSTILLDACNRCLQPRPVSFPSDKVYTIGEAKITVNRYVCEYCGDNALQRWISMIKDS